MGKVDVSLQKFVEMEPEEIIKEKERHEHFASRKIIGRG